MRPELWDAYWAYAQVVYEHSCLPLREFEAARMRIAHINGCQLCLAVRFARDHMTLDEDVAFWDRLHAAFSDEELVDLGLSVGAFLAGGRFAHVFGADRACPVAPR